MKSSNEQCPEKGEGYLDTDTQGIRPCEAPRVKKEAEKAGNSWDHQKPEEARKDSCLELAESMGLLTTWFWNSGLQNSERIFLLCSANQVCGNLGNKYSNLGLY